MSPQFPAHPIRLEHREMHRETFADLNPRYRRSCRPRHRQWVSSPACLTDLPPTSPASPGLAAMASNEAQQNGLSASNLPFRGYRGLQVCIRDDILT